MDNTKFDQTVADRYDLLDVFFWSPSRLKAWKKLGLGVEMPCALQGWKHKEKVTVKQRWAFRLVKGVFFDSILAGQECVCSECRKEHDQVNKHYLAAKSANDAESGSSCRPDEGHRPLAALADRRPRRRLLRMAARDRPATPALQLEADGYK